MNLKYFFISDVHLGTEGIVSNKDRMKHFISFLSYVSAENGRLFILGDLFDFWFEYKYVIPKEFFPVLTALENFRKNGLIDYIVGNHDFWVDDFFEKTLGIPVHQNEYELEINKKKIYLHHGDGIAKKDVGYRILKRILRHPVNTRLYRLIHPDFGFAMAHYFSRLSRNNSPPQDKDDDYADFAREKIRQGFDAVILGHTHYPAIIEQTNGVYLNTGDWVSNFSYGFWDGENFSLNYWNSSNNID